MPSIEGRELGGCRMIRKIGEGGMGEVYLAEQIRMGSRQVAVKVVRPDHSSYNPQEIADIERRFQREVAILASFDHPNILPVYDSGVEDGYLYLVMQYAPEGSLTDAIRGRIVAQADASTQRALCGGHHQSSWRRAAIYS